MIPVVHPNPSDPQKNAPAPYRNTRRKAGLPKDHQPDPWSYTTPNAVSPRTPGL